MAKNVKSHQQWVKDARALLTLIGGGATAFPPADGTWAGDDGKVIWELTRIVYSFVIPERFTAHIKELRKFVHRFGRETNQGEVVVEFDGNLYRITEFEPSVANHAQESQRRRQKRRAH
jgi:hypothetical protein